MGRPERGPDVDRSGTPDGLRDRWDADLDEWEPLARDVLGAPTLDRERSLIHRYIAGRTELLTRRVAAGHIVDGHGDLLSKDIFCLPDGPRILDCLEFDPRSAVRRRVGRRGVLGDGSRIAGEARPGGVLRPDVPTASPGTAPRRACSTSTSHSAPWCAPRSPACRWHKETSARRHPRARSSRSAVRHLDRARPFVIVVGGAPGTGKSTLAARLARAKGWVHLRSDEIRREIGAVGHGTTSAP